MGGCYQCGSTLGDSSRLCPLCADQRHRERAEKLPDEHAESESKNRLMLLALLVLVAATGFLIFWGTAMPAPAPARPSAAEVTAAVRNDLISRKRCAVPATVEAIRVSRVGTFDDAAGGYPVFGTFIVQCGRGASATVWSGGKDPKSPIAYVRRNAYGGIEAFTPAGTPAAVEREPAPH